MRYTNRVKSCEKILSRYTHLKTQTLQTITNSSLYMDLIPNGLENVLKNVPDVSHLFIRGRSSFHNPRFLCSPVPPPCASYAHPEKKRLSRRHLDVNPPHFFSHSHRRSLWHTTVFIWTKKSRKKKKEEERGYTRWRRGWQWTAAAETVHVTWGPPSHIVLQPLSSVVYSTFFFLFEMLSQAIKKGREATAETTLKGYSQMGEFE